jgi:hypothetical protein
MIGNFCPFPNFQENGELRAGLTKTENSICRLCVSKECAKVGFDTREMGIVKRCFRGLDSVYIEDFLGERIVIPGFLLKGRRYPDDHKTLLKSGFELNQQDIDSLVAAFARDGRVHRAIIDMEKQSEGRALHDLKHLIGILSRQLESSDLERVTRPYSPYSQGDVELMRRTISSAYHVLGVMKQQIEMSDYILAPNAGAFIKEAEIEIYPLFDKNVRVYRILAAQTNKEIDIRSSSGFVAARRILKENFTLLPAIFLQNAIKYSEENSEIVINIFEQDNKVTIVVSSYGPTVPEEDQNKIWELGARYTHPNDTSRGGGGGFGLYLAKTICVGSGFDVAYQAEARRVERGVPMGVNHFIVSER